MRTARLLRNVRGDESILWTILLLLLLLGGIGSLSGYAGILTDLFLVGAIAVFLINLCSPRLGHAVLR
jgi:hypothetical protein